MDLLKTPPAFDLYDDSWRIYGRNPIKPPHFIGDQADVGDSMIGEDISRLITAPDPLRPNEIYAQISESRVGRCVRTADYLYSVYAPGLNGWDHAASDVYADDFLYDLNRDPDELCNLISDPAYGPIKEPLREKLLAWIERAEGARPRIIDAPEQGE